jgi:hypothetical protein
VDRGKYREGTGKNRRWKPLYRSQKFSRFSALKKWKTPVSKKPPRIKFYISFIKTPNFVFEEAKIAKNLSRF